MAGSVLPLATADTAQPQRRRSRPGITYQAAQSLNLSIQAWLISSAHQRHHSFCDSGRSTHSSGQLSPHDMRHKPSARISDPLRLGAFVLSDMAVSSANSGRFRIRRFDSDQSKGFSNNYFRWATKTTAHIFGEHVSSIAKRAKLAECLAFLRESDVLIVTKPERLARSTAELLSIEADLSKRGIGLVVLSAGCERLDTRNPTSKLMLTILAGVATWEREIMLERQREDIAKTPTTTVS